MGGGNITVKTVKSLPKDIDVKILEHNKLRINHLIEKIDNAMIINGDARDLQILKEENIEQMDAFVALSENSEANILSCLAAKRFGLQKTIAEVENIDYIQLAESLDIGTIINKKMLAASYIYQYTLDADVHNVKGLTHVDAEVVELTAKRTPLSQRENHGHQTSEKHLHRRCGAKWSRVHRQRSDRNSSRRRCDSLLPILFLPQTRPTIQLTGSTHGQTNP